MRVIGILTVALFLGIVFETTAQYRDEEFGKNRVQYKQFEWKYITSENFEVYYYGEGGNIAEDATRYLESQFDRITDMMGHPPSSKTKIFLYNSQTDLQQSNVGIDYQGPISGGETQFIKSNIEIAHPGTISEFKEELLYKVTSLLLNEMLYGGSLKDMLQSTLMNLPEWLTEGAALYISKGWTVTMDDYARELHRKNNNVKLQKLSGYESALAGQSIWNYIAERHGKSNISSILNYIKIIRNEEKSIAITLGIPFRELLIDWRRFYLEMDQTLGESFVSPSEEEKYTSNNRKGVVLKNVKFSPDGMKIAYSINDRGAYKVMVYDIATDEEVVVTKGGNKVVNQDVNYNLPLMSWVDDNTLGFIDARKGKNVFWLYDVVSESKIPRVLEYITEVKSLDFNSNGRLGILSATVNGFNDLYLMSTRRDQIRRLTNDFYDDIDATFIPNSNTILFSSNRKTDTLNVRTKDFAQVNNNFNLFTFNLDTTKTVLNRLTNTLSKDVSPVAINREEIIYLSDQRGIKNLFKYNISTSIYSQLTNYRTSIKEYHYNNETRSLVFVALDESKDFIYFIEGFDINQQNFTPPSPRKQILLAREVKIRRQQREREPTKPTEQLSMKQIIDQKLEQKAKDEEQAKAVQDTVKSVQKDLLDTDNYTFEEEVKKAQEQSALNSNSFLSQYRRIEQNSTISGPYDFETLFSADKISSSLVIDPLRQLGILVESSMKDMLEDHSFSGGLMSTTDLRSGDIWGEYEFFKYQIDYGVRFDREVLYWTKETDINPTYDRYISNTLTFKAAYPFNVRNRIEVKPYLIRTTYNDLGRLEFNGVPSTPPTTEEEIARGYVGATVAYVYDNSVVPGMNLKEGTRAKIQFSHWESLRGSEQSFSNIQAEIRHYQKIHREITIAGRIIYGNFFGNAPKNYMIGGLNNWMFNSINTRGNTNPVNPEIPGDRSELLFARFVTPIRGFDMAELYGNDVLALNAELRVPLVKYLNSGYIASNFFRNLQFIGFFDVGSSWTGRSPFNPSNTISTEIFDPVGAFQVTLKNFKNPWLMSYGAGFRTMILGYFTRFDLAWPIIDNVPQRPRLSLSLGFDF